MPQKGCSLVSYTASGLLENFELNTVTPVGLLRLPLLCLVARHVELYQRFSKNKWNAIISFISISLVGEYAVYLQKIGHCRSVKQKCVLPAKYKFL